MIGGLDAFDRRQVDDAQLVGLGADAAGFDVVIERFRHASDGKGVGGATFFGAHVGLLPLGSAGVFTVNANDRRGKADQVRADDLGCLLAQLGVTRLNL